MQISIQALMKLAIFLVASAKVVDAGVLPQSVILPLCTDLVWDEQNTGLQTQACTMPYRSNNGGKSQAVFAKRSDQEVDHHFDSIFSSLQNTTESGMDGCAPVTNTTSTSNQDVEQGQSSNHTSDSTIERREACAKHRLPYRSELIDQPDIQSKSWCFRPGPRPNNNDITSMCRNIDQVRFHGSFESPKNPFHDDFVVQRARVSVASTNGNATVEGGGPCVCIAGREKSAGFKVCNCDRCDALVINRGLSAMCKMLQTQCTKKGYSSAYIKSALSGAMSNSIIALYSYPNQKGPKGEYVELDPVLGEEGTIVGSCRSGSEDRQGQDHSGPVIQCRDWIVGKFARGQWCKDMIAGGNRKWIKNGQDPFKVLRGKKQGDFSQFGEE